MSFMTTNVIKISTRILKNAHCFEDGMPKRVHKFYYKVGPAKITLTVEVSMETGDRWVRFLSLDCDHWPEEKTLNCLVGLDYTPCHFGNCRWWFLCTSLIKGQICRRRVGVLYILPTDTAHFACRNCLGLRYPETGSRKRKSTREREEWKKVLQKVAKPDF